MKSKMERKEFRYLDCAFERFFARRYPFNVDTRVYQYGHINGLHNHDFPQLAYCIDGRYIHRVENQYYDCQPGSVVMIPPGVFHRIIIPEGSVAEIMFLNLTYDIFLDAPANEYINATAFLYLQPFSKELGYTYPNYILLSNVSIFCLEQITSWLTTVALNPPNKTTQEETLHKLEELFSLPEFRLPDMYHHKAEQLAQTRLNPILLALRYINANCNEKITEDKLLQVSAICHTDFYRYFKRYTSYTFSVYIQRLRTQRAYAYLLNTSFSLSYISDICGFSDAAHMSRVYYKYMGATPRVSRIEKRKIYGVNPNRKRMIDKF